MKRMFFVSVVLILVFITITPLFSGGGQSTASIPAAQSGVYQRDPNLNPPGTFQVNKTKVPIKVGVDQYAMVQDWETNWMTIQIEQKGNYDLTFETYPEFQQKIELMIMAGGADLPDVLWGGVPKGSLVKFAEAGMIIPLDVYYKNSANYINQALPQFDVDILKYITSYDGHVYGIPNIIATIGNEYNSNWFMLYEPWLEKVGLPRPKTIAEFETMLKAFKEKDPNGNGIQDEIPIIGNNNTSLVNMLRALMNPFIYTQNDFWILNNGKIDVAFNKPAWREGLRYVKSLIDQGLISPLSYTQNETQMNAMIMSEPQIIGLFARISESNLPDSEIRRWDYKMLGPLEGPGGVNAFWNPTIPGIGMTITKNCKNPEAAFMLGDLMCSEEMSIANRYGEKGVNFGDPGPGDIGANDGLGFSPSFRIIADAPVWGIVQNKIYAQRGPYMIPSKFADGATFSPAEYPYRRPSGPYIVPWIAAANKNPIVGLIYNEQEQEVLNEFHSTIINYVQESYTRFVMGDLSIDREWDSYVAEFNRMNLTEVIRVTQSCWDRMNQ